MVELVAAAVPLSGCSLILRAATRQRPPSPLARRHSGVNTDWTRRATDRQSSYTSTIGVHPMRGFQKQVPDAIYPLPSRPNVTPMWLHAMR